MRVSLGSEGDFSVHAGFYVVPTGVFIVNGRDFVAHGGVSVVFGEVFIVPGEFCVEEREIKFIYSGREDAVFGAYTNPLSINIILF